MIASGFLFSFLVGVVVVNALPTLEPRQTISSLKASQIAAYKPYTYYAAASYCDPAKTLAWACGLNCNSNPGFKPVASGGNGGSVQYWYVGYDPTLKTIIVGYQGTNTDKILPVITNANFVLDSLDSALFPGVSSSVKTHNGFGNAHAKSAAAVLAGVKKAISTYSATKVTLVGHSLGGALAVIATAHLSVNLPSTISLRTITYGMPRVGNQAFADFINARSVMSRVNNKDDIVPILPGRFLNFDHTEGEVHIVDNGSWISCSGQDNTNSECTIGYVPDLLSGNTDDHGGPYDGVKVGSATCSL
ncbi:lipase [Crucibulum laeve]|uniref:Lipase n=1 Tax=Crucibulum laeve TaxID=68775 RepID=A0A5C3M2R0_9AGAR|nr:lipase [Crucibulum laeve]